jgi:hypothetical protein
MNTKTLWDRILAPHAGGELKAGLTRDIASFGFHSGKNDK